MASVHLDQRREAVSGRRVAFEAQSGGFVAMAVRWPCSCRPGCLRAVLGRGAFRLLQGLRCGGRGVLAAAPASVLLGQQTLPLGFVVSQMA